MKENKLIILTGPTGVGKTKYSIELAKEFNGEIISADAFQIYKYMDVGTAKIMSDEMEDIKHYNLDFLEPYEDYNVSIFKENTLKDIEFIKERGKIPFLVGGTGLYIHSIINDLDFSGGESDEDLRKKIENEIELYGLESIYNKLIEIDPEISKKIDKNNKNRVIRAYEIYLKTNESPLAHLDSFRKSSSNFDYLYIVINDDRDKLYENINARVDKMVNDGLFEEVDFLLNKGINFDFNSMKAIGYREFSNFYDGSWSREETIDKIKQHSRNFAKRQLTWFRRVEESVWFNKNDYKNEEDFYKSLKNKVSEFLSE